MLYVLDELEENDSDMLVTSRLADQVGITRSVIVNGLRKCESAGIISTKSGGMKGTSIHLLNERFTDDPELYGRAKSVNRSCIFYELLYNYM